MRHAHQSILVERTWNVLTFFITNLNITFNQIETNKEMNTTDADDDDNDDNELDLFSVQWNNK